MSFKDYFSQTASDYAIYRPHYPKNLFTFLNTLVQEHGVAWDCATGNGQVANQLVNYFDQVYASDGSEQQISQAQNNERINYFVSLAENSLLESNSIDLITVAQAFHWFNQEAFWTESPDGI
ncbi:methyltransferase domain-containing protein [Aphanothece sacrum]|uniref:Methyltransferase n=1 Tax=Aphanothece sacrum FPU1 TaxID=1920663 RepID=A0A401IEP1_APHSA|nr:methyltransferase domain-containing protein [Aphanothece sacrum]GBF79696.1 methyltransferase [Aphanothece sacrum FPU1]GBF87157.1 methyltransferase [Aphanothece sacrum FPU3]